MQKRISEIAEEFSGKGLISSWSGPDNEIIDMPDIKECGPKHLAFVERAEFVEQALINKPGGIVTHADLAEHFIALENTAILLSSNVRLTQALLRQTYTDRNLRQDGWDLIHETAVIHPSATIGKDAKIGPGVVIEQEVVIGSNCIIMANCVIQTGSRIGADTIIHPNSVVSYDCSVGERCILKACSVIGMEGFGFAQDEKRKSYRIPQMGTVIIGDDVVIGANSTVDRGAFGPTRVGNGCKLDTHVHIAHGCEIGEDCLFVSQVGVAGTTKVGKRVIFAGQAGVIDHINICDDVVLAQRAGVINDITEPGAYGGHPAQPIKQFFKNAAAGAYLADMRKKLNTMERRLKALEKDEE